MEENEHGMIDVSEPREIRREKDIVDEALAIHRREWFKSHLSIFFAVIGVILVALIGVLILMHFQNNNPFSIFSSALYKDFGTPFAYQVAVSEDDDTVMSYTGTIEVDRSRHTIKALYRADYNTYSYTGAVCSDEKVGVSGNLFNETWTTHDCKEMAQNFFDFDADFRYGSIDCGAFMRFTGLTSDYSIQESAKFFKVVKERLTTDSALAVITTETTEEQTRYHYDVDLYSFLELVKENGAPIFFRSSDYDSFCLKFDCNKEWLASAKCTIEYVVNADGYMTSFDAAVVTPEKKFALSCTMSDFGAAQTKLPDEFMQIIQTPAPTE